MRHIAQRPDIRDLILDAVNVLLGRYGLRKMTMDDLAREVGIGKGTIYLHFRSKDELALAHIDRLVDRVLAALQSIAAEADPPGARLRRMLAARVLIRLDSVAHYSQNINELLVSVRKPLLVRREQHFEREAAVLAGVLEAGRKAGAFKFADARETARALVWATNALLPYSLTAKELGGRAEIERRVLRIADLVIGGLATEVPDGRTRHRTAKKRK